MDDNFLVVAIERKANSVGKRIEDLQSAIDLLQKEKALLEEANLHLKASHAFLHTNDIPVAAPVAANDSSAWSSMSMPDALVKIALNQGGTLRTVDAIHELVAMNVCQSIGQARSGIYRALVRRPFVKESAGLYRLREPTPAKPSLEALFTPDGADDSVSAA